MKNFLIKLRNKFYNWLDKPINLVAAIEEESTPRPKYPTLGGNQPETQPKPNRKPNSVNSQRR